MFWMFWIFWINFQNLFESGEDVGGFAGAELEEDETGHAIGAGGVDLTADFVERESFRGNADAGENPFRRSQLADLTLDICFEEHRRGLVVHGANEINAVRSEPICPILRDGLASDFEIGEDGDGNFGGWAGGFDGLCAFGDKR